MSDKYICKKVVSLLSLYIDNKVTYNEREFIEEHLAECEECHKKYMYLKSLIHSLKDSYRKVLEIAMQKQKKATFSIREHEKFMENISPYIDNELESSESFEFRRYLMKSKVAQKELRQAYYVQKEMTNAFEITKKDMNVDFSKNIISEFKEKENRIPAPKIYKVAIVLGLLMFGAVEVKQFYVPVKSRIEKNIQKKAFHLPEQSVKIKR